MSDLFLLQYFDFRWLRGRLKVVYQQREKGFLDCINYLFNKD